MYQLSEGCPDDAKALCESSKAEIDVVVGDRKGLFVEFARRDYAFARNDDAGPGYGRKRLAHPEPAHWTREILVAADIPVTCQATQPDNDACVLNCSIGVKQFGAYNSGVGIIEA